MSECARACAYGLPPTAAVDGLEIEAAGPLVLRTSRTCSVVLCGFTWSYGSSSVTQGDIQIGAKWSQVQRLRGSNGSAVWYKVKLCIGLSRGLLVSLVTLAFPGSLLRALREVLGRREGSYADTLLARLIREGGSTSEHRNGLCAVVPFSHVYLGTTASDTGSLGESMRRRQDCANIDVRTEKCNSNKGTGGMERCVVLFIPHIHELL